MARLMSFAMTVDAILDKSKTVTRRMGWTFLKPGDELRAVRKSMGRKKGEPIEDLARIRVVSVRREQLMCICDECEGAGKEGFPQMNWRQFVQMFCKAMKCGPLADVTRIEFEYIAAVPTPAAEEGEEA